MKNIKYFKYRNTKSFEKFLESYGYKLDDAVGYRFVEKQQYRGNVLKEYIIFLSDHDYIFFKAAVFKSFNEYRQSALGFNGNKLLE